MRGREVHEHYEHYEHYGCFSSGDLDGFPPLLPLKSLYRSLKLIVCRLILLNVTLCLLYLHPPLGRTD